MNGSTAVPYKLMSLFHLGPENIYKKFAEYRLSSQELKDHGFPLISPNDPGKVEITSISKFSRSLDPESQICRCGKQFSMLEDQWYVASDGCFYHSRKRARTGPNANLYECCNNSMLYEGCTYSNYHVSTICPTRDVAFKNTKIHSRMSSFPSIYALDCEMCFTTEGMEIVKISIVALNGDVVYDAFVKPKNKVLDYNTPFSGVDCKDLENVHTSLEDVHFALLEFIGPNSILIGHSLENDLLGLHIIHEYVVDTSVVFPHERGFPYKNSLKSLAFQYLGKSIQDSYNGHDSVEDARTCLELMIWKITSQLTDSELYGTE